MTDFDVFERRYARASRNPTLTVTVRGTLNLNEPAFELLGKPEAVVLLYARAERIIGLRPAEKSEPNAYRVGKLGQGKSRTIVAKDFCAWIEADLNAARRYPMALDDGVGCVDLNTTPRVVTGRRRRTGG